MFNLLAPRVAVVFGPCRNWFDVYARLAAVLAIFCNAQLSVAATIVDTGPGSSATNSGITVAGPNNPFVISNGSGYQSSLAGMFTLSQATTIDSIKAWMWTNTSSGADPTLHASIYSNVGAFPGQQLFTSAFDMSPAQACAPNCSPSWQGPSGLSWNMSPGSYWIVFEGVGSDTGFGSAPFPVPSPLAAYAFQSPTLGPQWNTLIQANAFGIQVSAATPPASGALNIANLTIATSYVRDCSVAPCGPTIFPPIVQALPAVSLGGLPVSVALTNPLGIIGSDATGASAEGNVLRVGAFANSNARVSASAQALQQYTYTGAAPLHVTGTGTLSYSQVGANLLNFDSDAFAVGSILDGTLTFFRYAPGLIPIDTGATAAPGRCAVGTDTLFPFLSGLVTCLQGLPGYQLLQAVDLVSDGTGSQSFTLDFTLQPGQKFYVLGEAYAFARLGGQLDARHTFEFAFDDPSLFVATPPTVEVAGPDADGDGVPDSRDACPETAAGTAVGENGCPLPPPDADGDGVPDATDACPNTPPGSLVDANGCAPSQLDSDGDGVSDAVDQCPNTAPNTAVDANGCSAAQRDSDHDGVADSIDACPNTPAGTKVDATGCPVVQQGRVCDVDSDNDVDKYDIRAIVGARGQSATGANDPRDANRDGKIDLRDAAICALKCDRWFCASP